MASKEPNKFGLLDTVLQKHMQLVSSVYEKNRDAILASREQIRAELEEKKTNPTNRNRDQESVSFRNEGNAFFKKGDYYRARILYTRSLAEAIKGECAALAYSNRSAVLFHMKFYEDCLKDIERAISQGYPEHNQHKLYLRKARCLKYLAQNFEASLETANQLVKKHNKEDVCARLKAELAKEMELPEPVLATRLPQSNEWTLPPLSYGTSKEVPSFSSAVDLQYNEKFGRHIVANRDLNTGDVLIVDNSFLFNVAEVVKGDYCSKCFKHCLSSIPCQSCGYVMYCSEECLGNDWDAGHKMYCFFNQRFLSGDIYYNSAITTETVVSDDLMAFGIEMCCLENHLICHFGVDNLKNALLQNEPMESFTDPRTKGFEDGEFNAPTLEAVLSLEDNIDKQSGHYAEDLCLNALDTACYYDASLSELLPLAAIFFKLHLVVYNNLTTIYAQNDIGFPRRKMGLSLSLASSLINHSCDPNMYQVNYGSTRVYRARRPIKKGEQLTESYHNKLASDSNYTERQFYIQSLLDFDCRCEACVKQWPVSSRLPKNPPNYKKMAKAVGIDLNDPEQFITFYNFLQFNILADVELMPKTMHLLDELHKKDKRQNQMYIKLQECIQSHYRAQGNCLLFNGAKM